MNREEPGTGECYHVYNRGVEKRTVFTSVADYERFMFSVFACNAPKPFRFRQRGDRGLQSVRQLLADVPGQLVDLICFCLMPNHFHLLLRQRCDNGIALYLQKLLTAYTMYFNKRYDHSGVLFQGTYQRRHVDRDEYLLPVSRYIHLNPLDLSQPGWQERGITDPAAVHQVLLDYPWSSYGEYAGRPRYAPFVATGLLSDIFGSPERYASYVTRGWQIVPRVAADPLHAFPRDMRKV